MNVYRTLDSIDFVLADCPAVPLAGRVLMTTPDHFEVAYVINPHMEGNIGSVDRSQAAIQWQSLRQTYEQLGIASMEIAGVENQPDMVFCANQTLPYYNPRSGERGVVLSRMHAPERKQEVDHYQAYFSRLGYETVPLPEGTGDFEGMGDALWHPGRYLLWGGSGYRTEESVYEFLSDRLNVRVVALRLVNSEFYHLDTCLSLLSSDSALYYPGAFDEEGLALLQHFFPKLIEAPEDEARELFACNAHCPDEKHVIIQKGCEVTVNRLRSAGFIPIELDTSEFLKSGGSVFCMKQMLW